MAVEFLLFLCLVDCIGAAPLHMQCLNGLFVHNGQCLTRWQICRNSSLYNEDTGKCDPCMKGYYVAEGSSYCLAIKRSRPENKPKSADVPRTEATPITEQPETTHTPHASDKVVVDNVTVAPSIEVNARDINETASKVTEPKVAINSSDGVTPSPQPDEKDGLSGLDIGLIIASGLALALAICVCVFRKSIRARFKTLRKRLSSVSCDSVPDDPVIVQHRPDQNVEPQEAVPLAVDL